MKKFSCIDFIFNAQNKKFSSIDFIFNAQNKALIYAIKHVLHQPTCNMKNCKEVNFIELQRSCPTEKS